MHIHMNKIKKDKYTIPIKTVQSMGGAGASN